MIARRAATSLALATVLILSTGQAAEPEKQPAERPQYQRLLQGEDAKQASDLERRIDEKEAADQYAEAITAAERLLALRRRTQGAGHHETVTARWDLEALRKLAALPAAGRAEWREAESDNGRAARLEGVGNYAAALPLKQKVLGLRRRVLGERHPRTAAALNNVAYTLDAMGKYAEAEPLYRQALERRLEALGEDHPDTAAGYSNLALALNAQAKYAEAEALLRKALAVQRAARGPRNVYTAYGLNNLAFNLNAQGKYPEAEPLLRDALGAFREAQGEGHENVLTALSNLAVNLHFQGKFAEAEVSLREALQAREKALGGDHPDVGTAYNNLAINLDAQGRHAQTEPLYRRALAIRRKALGEAHPVVADGYNNLAANLATRGRYAEAGPLLQKALEAHRRALGDDHPDTANGYNNLAYVLSAQGREHEAESLYRKALDVRRRAQGDGHPETAPCYNNLALVLNAQGRHAEAEPLFRQALTVWKQTPGEAHPDALTAANNLALNLYDQGDYSGGEALLRSTLALSRKASGPGHPVTAQSIYNLAANLEAQRRHAEAEPLFQEALGLHRRLFGEGHGRSVQTYTNLAHNLLAQGKDAEALAALRSAAQAYEATRLRVSAHSLGRAAFGAEQSPYPSLAAAQARAGRPAEAWRALESDLARGLLDEAGRRGGARLTEAEEGRRQELLRRLGRLEASLLPLVAAGGKDEDGRKQLERLTRERAEAEEELAGLAAALSRRGVAALARLQAALPADAALVAWIDVHSAGGVEEHWGCVVRAGAPPAWARLPAAGGTWTREDGELPGAFRRSVSSPPGRDRGDLGRLTARLAAQRLEPLRAHLEGVRRLLVVPVYDMAGTPVAALTEKYTVSYLPSGTELTRRRPARTAGAARLLALGDPVFARPDPARAGASLPGHGLLVLQVGPGLNAERSGLRPGDVLLRYGETRLERLDQLRPRADGADVGVEVWRAGKELRLTVRPGRLGVELDKRPAPEALRARRETDRLVATATRGGDYGPLPGTRRETAAIAGLFARADVLLGPEASEQRLEELRTGAGLGQYSHLHLATHGEANGLLAFESALVLAQDRLPDNGERVAAGQRPIDGRLTAREVLQQWELDADLVTLSACESGLGREGGGEGLLGFSQAFLTAGARSVLLSLWPVDDTATALLMQRFYQNLLGKRDGLKAPLPKAEALREAQAWLRGLSVAEATAAKDGLPRGRPVPAGRPVEGPRPGTDRPYAHPYYWAAFILVGDPN